MTAILPIISALLPTLSSLSQAVLPSLIAYVTGSKTHDELVADLQAAASAFAEDIRDLPSQIAADDADLAAKIEAFRTGK